MSLLADVNFLVALIYENHAHHLRAMRWLAALPEGDELALCRVTQMGVLRILTNSRFLKSDTRQAAGAWSDWQTVRTDSRFVYLDEPAGLEREWKRLTAGLPAGAMVETDSYLAAFALAAGIPILTFDRGFERWPRLDVEIPA